jgi:hypothetical protein
MDWHGEIIDRLARAPCGGYGGTDGPATEPSALAALALARAQRWDAVRVVADWLHSFQDADGSVGVRPEESQPGWPTSLAVLTWSTVREADGRCRYQPQIDRAFSWMVKHQGVQLPPDAVRGHDGMLEAWPWVDGTHAWLEPTALHVLALKQIGRSDHPRTRSAVAMLFDRQLPHGGFNYGNTIILGRELRPHVQPTGLALLALAGEPDATPRVGKSLDFLISQLGPDTTTASLAWSLLALAAFKQLPDAAGSWLTAAYHRTLRRGASHHKLALLALAAQGLESGRKGLAT